ncbi:MAG TPA: hypothetical protein VGH19_02805 [Verrucomicrobiae bacterium]
MRRRALACLPVVVLLITGCSALSLPRDPVTNRINQGGYYDHYERVTVTDEEAEAANRRANAPSDADRILNQKPPKGMRYHKSGPQ